ncbi:MAG: response regulator transcription factor [Eggerthellaceae bacterium]|nr:response regulator transcription factor [Eggerthellaceae bacterium]MDR2721662.1 response regulator transcription factor [Coriobacteriaceae bacterium]
MRLVLADDHEVIRAGIKILLTQDPELSVVVEAADGVQAYDAVVREKPDIILMDISMPPGESGLIACEKIGRECPETKIIVLTMFAEPEYLFKTLRLGASGYLPKTSTSEELLSAIHAVYEGGTYIHPKMAASLTKQLFAAESGDEENPHRLLTKRESEIFTLLIKGFTNKQISEQMYLSVKTVEAHRSKIYGKMGFKCRADLMAYAIEHKLLEV